MQPDKHIPDDLDYLAELGFEATATSPDDLHQLLKQIKAKSFSYNSGGYFAFLCILLGAFLGLSLFFLIYEAPPDKIPFEAPPVLEAKSRDLRPANLSLKLDTVTVTRENFTLAKAFKSQRRDSSSTTLAPYATDSIEIIPARTIDLRQPLKEEKLKFIANAPVVYIQGYKITDYTTLYFKKNQFVPFAGTSAAYTDKQATTSRPHFKEQADYYLHEELDKALLQFKKGNYGACIYSLNAISTYNKEDVNCDFYLGMCYYYRGAYDKAIIAFERSLQSLNNSFLQEADYYNALCLYKSGNKEKSLQLLKYIVEEGGFYSGKAQEFLLIH